VDAPALPRQHFVSLRALVVALGLLLVLGTVSITGGTATWLRSYAPLKQGSSYGGLWYRGHSEGVQVPALNASGGIPVLFPRYRPHARFHVTLTLWNQGRLAVKVLGLAKGSPAEAAVFVPTAMEVAPPNQYGFHWRPLDPAHPVRISPGEERTVQVTYRFAQGCVGGQPRRYWTERGGSGMIADNRVDVRIQYARFFDRSQSFRMPFAMELVCVGSIRRLSN